MRVLLSAIGSRGEIEPTMALALQLQELGHEVRMVAPPDFRGLADAAGIPFVPVGPEVRLTAKRMTPEEMREAADKSVLDQFEAVSTAGKGFDAVVGAGMLQFAAHSAAENLGVPYFFGTFCAMSFPSPHHAPPAFGSLGESRERTEDNETLWEKDRLRFNAFLAVLNSCRESAGLPAISDVRSHMFGEQPMLAADPVLGPWPDPADTSVVQTGAWLRRDQRPLDPELARFLDAGEPPIYFGFGSMFVKPEYSRSAIEAARALGRRAIVLRGWADLSLVDESDDVLAVGEVNHQEVFKRSAAVVHHGGAGTTTTAALSGVPQVIVPQMFDQFYWAEQVEHLGIGREQSSDELAEAVEFVMRPEMVASAQEVSAGIRTDGAMVAAQRITSR
ncbi:glycosyltransferase [Kibdelosporangium aridum]|uniref:Glycosyltransferase n=1 Tax=Kibdelosporangium aridum TaxID=2030 RepID=A0A428YZG5_KIBAR|nr:glycosyltransferase [Kibdelosporangium aridum]RSM76791.1 glycosyltransferase [Kibdelosporangium aridum]